MTVHPLTAPLNEALERANLSRPGGTPLNKFDIAEVVTVRVSSPTAEKLDQHGVEGSDSGRPIIWRAGRGQDHTQNQASKQSYQAHRARE